MKTCPKCGELVGDNVQSCFNCHYDFALHRMPTAEERRASTERRQAEIENVSRRHERREELKAKYQKTADARRDQLWDLSTVCEAQREAAYSSPDESAPMLNDAYEYDVLSIRDFSSGDASVYDLRDAINKRAKAGWRLIAVTTNEHVQNSSIRSLNSIDNTLLFFERRIYSPDKLFYPEKEL